MIRMPESRFVKVRCKKCRNEQILFDKASTRVNCLVCGVALAEPTGGLAKLTDSVEYSEPVGS